MWGRESGVGQAIPAALLPRPRLRLLPGRAIQFPGGSFIPLWTSAFSRRTVIACCNSRRSGIALVRLMLILSYDLCFGSQECGLKYVERYTEKARRVIFFARYEASMFGSPYIETEHVLLGLLREDPALTSVVLPSAKSIDAIRTEIEERTTLREKTSTSVDLPLSNESNRVLAYAAEEAERFGHKHVGSDHLLLGLLREKGTFAAYLLNSRGLSLDRAREIVRKRQPTDGQAPDVVQIHGEGWDLEYVQAQLPNLQKFSWRKRRWKPLDILPKLVAVTFSSMSRRRPIPASSL